MRGKQFAEFIKKHGLTEQSFIKDDLEEKEDAQSSDFSDTGCEIPTTEFRE
jgi:hypothetical protein